ncbi:hypothetical protein EJ08DRAFT_692553 [Tothia fuscella]|uniref:Uncharacterized protein n=1 Tax=Tothia fuscella TaxID=1048955 RepID=A0A9P4P109_9PEZI|nr:hypothetical protein EJ08DRAFT_692553 [Tothia fuscella]
MLLLRFLPLLSIVGIGLAHSLNAFPAEQYFSKMISVLARLDNSLKNIPPGGSYEEAVQRSQSLVRMQAEQTNILISAATDVRRGPSMAGTEVGERLMPLIQRFTRLYQTTGVGWVNAKEMVQASGGRNNVYQELIKASKATAAFTEAYVEKLPPGAQARARGVGTRIVGFLDIAIRAYRS